MPHPPFKQGYKLRNPFSILQQFDLWFNFEKMRHLKGEHFLATKLYDTVYAHDLIPVP